MKLKLLRQLLKMSKVTLYAFIINGILLIAHYAAGGLNAQSIKSIRELSIHLALKNANLVDVFKVVKAQIGHQFTYRLEDLDQEAGITKGFNEPAKITHNSENFSNENVSGFLQGTPSFVTNFSDEINIKNV